MTVHAKKNGHRFTIRHKLFLVSLSLLIIPWFGYRYVVDMNSYLLQNQEQALLDRARVVAAVLHERPELFQTESDQNTLAKQHLYVRALNTPITIDGYSDDWLPYRDRLQLLDQDAVIKHQSSEAISLSASYQLGSFDGQLYMLFHVKDNVIVYSQAGLPAQISDHMQLAITTRDKKIKHFLISTFAPGRVNVRPMLENGQIDNSSHSMTPIEAEWQEVSNGYNIELRIPLVELGDRIGFTLADVDNNKQPKITTVIGTLNKDLNAALGSIIVPSQAVEALLERLKTPSSRTWVVDQIQRVIARTGEISNHEHLLYTQETEEPLIFNRTITDIILNVLLSQPTQDFDDDLADVSRLEGHAIDSALTGSAATHWRHTPDLRVTILTAAHPVVDAEGKVVGAVAIEETSSSSLMVQNRAMEIVISLSTIAFLTATIILFTFATRLTFRIRRLRNDADAAIAQDGRILNSMQPTNSSDEIGDLSRSFAEMVSRLSHYNRYLETMASKLSHELRTPLAVLRSSLENLETETFDQQNITYLERAKDGINRLNLIVTRMSEATRLEQTLQTEQKVTIDISTLMANCVAGYQLAFPNSSFELHSDTQATYTQGAADLIVQMLDKLVSNARDFATPGTPIIISIKCDNMIQLSVKNQGPHLPENMQASLFDSMISIREKRGNEPHLGLGLYIVRLIAEFHQGKVTAHNIHSPSGVEFVISLPRHFSS